MEVKEACEQMQEDIRTYLDGREDEIIDELCEIVIKQMKLLQQKLNEKGKK